MAESIIIANWKMNLSPQEGASLADDIKNKLNSINDSEVVLCPSFVGLSLVNEAIKESQLNLGAQDAFWQQEGSFTGEVSPKNLYDIGCRYVILGHSERRQYLGETDEMINKKISLSLTNKLVPILCVGETQEQKEEGQTDNVIFHQLNNALKKIDLSSDKKLIIAYEPIWAIGSGQVVGVEQADHIFKLIRQVLLDIWTPDAIDNTRLIYGGSVNLENVSQFNDSELCDGFLIGGASLNADEFVSIVKKVNNEK